MTMLACFERFGDLAFEEMRVLTVPPGNPVPADEYGFLEFYCTDDDCDCGRVIIKVVGRKSADKAGRQSATDGNKPPSIESGLGERKIPMSGSVRPWIR